MTLILMGISDSSVLKRQTRVRKVKGFTISMQAYTEAVNLSINVTLPSPTPPVPLKKGISQSCFVVAGTVYFMVGMYLGVIVMITGLQNNTDIHSLCLSNT